MSTTTSDPDLRHLTTLVAELGGELETATRTGDVDRADRLRGELALLEDLALPEAVSELRLQRITYATTVTAMARPLPSALLAFVG